MKLEGKLFITNRLTEMKEVVTAGGSGPFSMQLEEALVLLCRGDGYTGSYVDEEEYQRVRGVSSDNFLP